MKRMRIILCSSKRRKHDTSNNTNIFFVYFDFDSWLFVVACVARENCAPLFDTIQYNFIAKCQYKCTWNDFSATTASLSA